MSILRAGLWTCLLLTLLFGLGASDLFAQATQVTLQFFPFTGEVRLVNPNPDPFSFIFYSLESPSGGFNPANGVWTSISDTYDFSGNRFIDDNEDWVELDASTTKLTEVVVQGGSLPAFRAVSLGKIWNPNVAPFSEIAAQIVLTSGADAVVLKREALDGDYLANGIVDDTDYMLWKASFGATTAYYADGNIDGIINAADYTVWRDNFGKSLPGVGAIGGGGSALAASAVPEPATLLAALVAGGALLWRTRLHTSASN